MWVGVNRHRLPDNHPAQPTQWLVCNAFGDGCEVLSNLRTCRSCGRSVWVSALMCPLVDAGELAARCWDCQSATGDPVQLHERERAALIERGQLDRGWQVIDEANQWLRARHAVADY